MLRESRSPGVEHAARRLLAAARTRVPTGPVRQLLPDRSAETAYAVQEILTEHALAAGRPLVGRKVGLTSSAVQRQLAVDRPDFGVLFADMEVIAGTVVDHTILIQPRIEAEIAFVLAADLDGPDLDSDAVRAATEYVVPALEIVDSRIAGWDITFADTVADNASSALFVLGGPGTPLGDLDLTTVSMTLTDTAGTVVSTGTGADCLGDPVDAVLWLARTCRDLGTPIRRHEIVLSGALGPMVPISAETAFTAELSTLGSVSVGFSGRLMHPGDIIPPSSDRKDAP